MRFTPHSSIEGKCDCKYVSCHLNVCYIMRNNATKKKDKKKSNIKNGMTVEFVAWLVLLLLCVSFFCIEFGTRNKIEEFRWIVTLIYTALKW